MVNLNLADHNYKLLYEQTKDPTQELWRGVLKRAFEDAFMPGQLHLCDYERRDARDFVSIRSNNFDRVCDLAGLNPDYVWDKIQQFRKIKKEENYVW